MWGKPPLREWQIRTMMEVHDGWEDYSGEIIPGYHYKKTERIRRRRMANKPIQHQPPRFPQPELWKEAEKRMSVMGRFVAMIKK